MNTGKRRTIRKKVAQLILAVSLATVLLLGLATGVGLVNIRQDTVDSLGELNSRPQRTRLAPCANSCRRNW